MEESMSSDHLSETEISSLLIEPEQAVETIHMHIKECSTCRKRLSDLEGFTVAFHQQIGASEIDLNAARAKILLSSADRRLPFFSLRWGAVVASAFVIIACAFLLSQVGVISLKSTKMAEVGFLDGIHGFSEDMVESELPDGLQALSGWDRQDFRQFLDFFSPLEEEHYENNDSRNGNRSTSGIIPFPVA
jgi:hypothetical protein